MLKLASRMLDTIAEVRENLGVEFSMRIGLHIGQFIGGVIGMKKLRYDIWGSDVVIANLIEQHGVPGEICIVAK